VYFFLCLPKFWCVVVNIKLTLPNTAVDIRTTYFNRLPAYFHTCISYGSQIESDHLTNIVNLLLFTIQNQCFYGEV